MRYQRCEKIWLVRIDKGEEVVATLKQFCSTEGIRLASVHGIGATDAVTMGYFKTSTKEYVKTSLVGDHEITSLTGNISTMDGQVYLHLHVTLTDKECRALGGHLNSAVVSGTCELIISEMEGEIEREFDEEVGLNILKP